MRITGGGVTNRAIRGRLRASGAPAQAPRRDERSGGGESERRGARLGATKSTMALASPELQSTSRLKPITPTLADAVPLKPPPLHVTACVPLGIAIE